MSEVQPEPKEPSVWPWVIGLILFAILVWAFAEMLATSAPAAG